MLAEFTVRTSLDNQTEGETKLYSEKQMKFYQKVACYFQQNKD